MISLANWNLTYDRPCLRWASHFINDLTSVPHVAYLEADILTKGTTHLDVVVGNAVQLVIWRLAFCP